ncbi:MAG: transcriptional repressor LexA [Acidobacteria bacterium]|nr:transcriptional repressor LexA [Acidobacteriota bacterium]
MGRKRQFTTEQVLGAIQRWVVEHGMSPTVEELRVRLKVGSARTVLRYLEWLEADGAIERRSGARGVRLLRTSPAGIETKAVPLVGQVPAGPLMAAEENLEGWIRLPKSFLRPESSRFFLLRVRGDSMNRAKVGRDTIENGDLVLVRQQATAAPRDIVVGLIDGEATVKRFSPADGYGVLKPESSNPIHRPIVVGDDFRVLGVVDRVLKKGSEILDLIEE